MGPDPLPMAQMRRHVSDIEASSGEGAGCSGAITTAAFQADPFGTGLTDPLHERLMSTGVVGEGPLSHRHPNESTAHAASVDLWVSIPTVVIFLRPP